MRLNIAVIFEFENASFTNIMINPSATEIFLDTLKLLLDLLNGQIVH